MTRRYAIIAGGALAALLVAFLGGRFTAHPAPVAVSDTRKVETTKQATATAASTAHVEAIAHETATGDVDTKTTETRKWFPAVPAKSGCPELPAHVEETTTTETHAATTRTADKRRDSILAAKHEEQSSAHQAVVELHTVTPVQPSSSFALMPGVQFGGQRAISILGPMVIGASAEHRFIGPVFLGAWGNTSGPYGTYGITLRWNQ